MSSSNRPTINEVLDLGSGEIIKSTAFFCKSFDLIAQARSEQEKANQNLRPKWLVCAVCGNNVRILGGKDKDTFARSKNFHFAHLHNSDDCPIKTTSKYSKLDINRMKYRGVPESRLHIELKENIAKGLRLNQQTKGQVTEVNVEQVIRSLDEIQWKKPDINAVFNEQRIAIELQLSTTWLDVIVSRQHFYKERGIFILWVFNIFEASDDFRKLTQSDIIYTNNYNAFVLDPNAIERIAEKKDLVLQCYYLHYFADKAYLKSKWTHAEVTLDQLIFDPVKVQVYYKDVSKTKAAAEHAVSAYIEADRQREAEERRGRNRLINEKKSMEREVTNLREDIESLEKDQATLTTKADKISKKLAEVSEKIKSVTERAEEIYKRLELPRWFDLPSAASEIAEVYAKRLKAIRKFMVEEASEQKDIEQRLKNINACKQLVINSKTYYVLDKVKNWEYIQENYAAMFSYRTDQSGDLFNVPKTEPLNKLQIEQLRRNEHIVFLADFKEQAATYSIEIERLNRRKEKLSLIIVNDKNKFVAAIAQTLFNLYNLEEMKLLIEEKETDAIISNVRSQIVQKNQRRNDLNEKIDELYYLDYWDD